MQIRFVLRACAVRLFDIYTKNNDENDDLGAKCKQYTMRFVDLRLSQCREIHLYTFAYYFFGH